MLRIALLVALKTFLILLGIGVCILPMYFHLDIAGMLVTMIGATMILIAIEV
jgi:hypothetical protein